MDPLPVEVITRILKNLSVYDGRQSSIVNKTFHLASLDPKLLKREVFVYRDPLLNNRDEYRGSELIRCVHALKMENNYAEEIDDDSIEIQFNNFKRIILNVDRKLISLRFIGLRLQSINDITIFVNLNDRIVSIDFIDLCCLSNAFVDSITSHCNNLESLYLEKVHTTSIGNIESCKPLENLKSLKIMNSYITDEQFDKIMSCAPNLTEFGFGYPSGVKYYFNLDQIFTSNKMIIKHLQKSRSITSLELTDVNIFLDLPEHIKLKTLILSIIDDDSELLDVERFDLKLSQQLSLEKLVIKNVPCCGLKAILKLVNLKYLHIELISPTIFGNKEYSIRSFLESLNMQNIKTLIIVSARLVEGIHSIQDCILKPLTTLDCSIGNSLQIVNCCKYLTNLTLRKYDKYQDNCVKDLQFVLKNLTNLIHLSLYNMCLDDKDFLSLPLSDCKGLISLKIIGGELTYSSFNKINLPRLEMLTIEEIVLKQIKIKETYYRKSKKVYDQEGLLKFQDTLKELCNSCAPSLTNLTLHINCIDIFNSSKNPFDFELLKLYLPKMNNFIFDNNILKIRRF